MRRYLLVLVALVVTISGVALIQVVRARVFNPPVLQPIAFNHKLHTETNALPCDFCHTLYEAHAASGRPRLETCLICHSQPITESPEEEKIRQYRDRGEEIPWARVYVAPDNVYFSHRRHTVIAGIPCEECHGPIGSQERPPVRPLRAITMENCWDCHEERGASNDCLACHR